MTVVMAPTHCTTLAERLSAGPIPVAEALQYAIGIAEALRTLHQSGRAHGALSPEVIVIDGTAIDLMSASGAARSLAAASEEQGRADATLLSDIFSFGLVFHSLLTNHERKWEDFETRTAAALHATGNPAADRLIAACTAEAPGERPPDMDAILRELRLIAAASAESPEAAAQVRTDAKDDLGAPESGSRLDSLERKVEVLRSENERLERKMAQNVTALQKQIHDLHAALESARSYVAQTDLLAQRVVEVMEAIRQKLTHGA